MVYTTHKLCGFNDLEDFTVEVYRRLKMRFSSGTDVKDLLYLNNSAVQKFSSLRVVSCWLVGSKRHNKAGM